MVNIPIPTGSTVVAAIQGLSTLGQSAQPILRFPPILGTSITSVLTGAASSGITDAVSAALSPNGNALQSGLTGAGVAAAGIVMNQQQTYPYVLFQIIKYRSRWGIVDVPTASSGVSTDTSNTPSSPSTANPTISEGMSTVMTIALPLPTDLQDAISPSWEVMGMPIVGVAQGTSSEIKKMMQAGGDNLGSRVGQKITDSLKNTAAIISSTQQRNLLGNKTIANPRKQTMFNGIEPRNFVFNYLLSPQSAAEALTIEKIINAFRNFSLPSVSSGGLMFDFPCEYLITFNQTAMFPKISSCVCTSVTTNYSSAAMQLLSDGHPVQVGLTLTFTETDVRTQGDNGMQTISAPAQSGNIVTTITNAIKKL